MIDTSGLRFRVVVYATVRLLATSACFTWAGRSGFAFSFLNSLYTIRSQYACSSKTLSTRGPLSQPDLILRSSKWTRPPLKKCPRRWRRRRQRHSARSRCCGLPGPFFGLSRKTVHADCTGSSGVQRTFRFDDFRAVAVAKAF